MEEFLNDGATLRTRMWTTAGARYLAAGRLRRRERLSTFSIAILSVVAIAVGLVEPSISHGAQLVGVSSGAVTAIISVFILAISLIEGSSQAAVQASKLHDNAVLIAEARSEVESALAKSRDTGKPDWEALDRLRHLYETRIRECPFNHEPMDHQRFEATHRKSPEFSTSEGRPRMNWIACQWIRGRHLMSPAWLSFASWALVLALIFLVFDWAPLISSGVVTSSE